MAASPYYLQVLQNLSLILVSLLFLPLSTFILLVSYAIHLRRFSRYDAAPVIASKPSSRPVTSASAKQVNCRELHLPTTSPTPQNAPSAATTREQSIILVTGVGMTKGLHIARAFHLSHHRVIGADVAPYNLIPPIGRLSRAIDEFYTLPSTSEGEGSARYIQALLSIVQQEKISLWVSCSGVASALDDARSKEIIALHAPSCRCIQYDVQTTQLLHEKDAFTAHAASLSLPVPETHTVTTRAAVHKVLHKSPHTKRRYIMKSVDVDDASRAEINTLLPRRTLSETYNHIARLPISESKPWVLQQYVPGKREYCTHSLIVRGRVKAFVACPSSELLMHYRALPHPDDALSMAMLRFTEEFAVKSQQVLPGDDFTGHLSFDFLVEEQASERGVESVLRAIECNPRAHTAVALFQGLQGKEMVDAYLDALEEPDDAEANTVVSINGATHSQNAAHTKPEQEDEQQSSNQTTPHGQSQGQTPPPSPPFDKPIAANTTATVTTTTSDKIVVPTPSTTTPVYWIGHDVLTLLLLPLFQQLIPFFIYPFTSLHSSPGPKTTITPTTPTPIPATTASTTTSTTTATTTENNDHSPCQSPSTLPPPTHNLFHNLTALLAHLLAWHDGTYEPWDPLPFWWLYHVYWPGVFLGRLVTGKKWSRINVSTGKVFGC